MITYYKLLDMLNRQGMTREQLRVTIGAGPSTIAKISKNEPVTLTTIDKICEALNCQPGDILEYVSTEKEIKSTENC
ncbi:helix-turn-helix domain-containing protein [Robinsoniella peoriensis]|uniref:helix-turn-helix domain-containing protein n=1 Tax=Robinsoniella peoriensis TaxID=180332 RepID=UPI00290CCFF8|nr:helix-turn-helix transcriptional regulator [Clostridiales bacterium]